MGIDMGALGGTLRAFDDPNDPTIIRNVLSQEEDPRLIQLYKDYTTTKKGSAQDLDTYLAKYLSDTNAADSRTAQETGALDQFYNGGMSTKLFNLRAATKAARDKATEQSILGAQRNTNASRVLGDGGSSSYDRLLDARTRASIAVPGALQDVMDERKDLDYLTGNQIGLAGRRQAMTDATTGRLLTPSTMRRQQFMQNLQALTALGGEQRANTKYGLKQDPTWIARFADMADASDQGIMNGISAASSIMGMAGGMGGGGGSMKMPEAKNATSYNFAGVNSPAYNNGPSIPQNQVYNNWSF